MNNLAFLPQPGLIFTLASFIAMIAHNKLTSFMGP